MGKIRVAVRGFQMVLLCVLAVLLAALPAEGRGGRKSPVRPPVKRPPLRPRPTNPATVGARSAGGPHQLVYLSQQEKRFVTAMAHRLNDATARVIANPAARYTPGSLEARIRAAYGRMDAKVQAAMRTNARRLLALPTLERRRFFGARADVGRDKKRVFGTRADAGRGKKRGSHPSWNEAQLKKDLAVGVGSRLKLRARNGQLVRIPGVDFGTMANRSTWVEIGFFAGEVQTEAKKEVTISSPTDLDVRWGTKVSKAEEGRWELRRLGGTLGGELVGAGSAGNAPGRVFTIDLGKYLPATPPNGGLTYDLRIIPRTKMKIVPNASSQSGGSGSTKVPGKNVGLPSRPARIYYGKDTSPPQTFDFSQVYRKAEYTLASFRMITDQTEISKEEFHVIGFIHEQQGGTGKGVQHKFKHWYRTIPQDDRKKHTIDERKSFDLNNPDQPEWPRVYASVLSIMEEDGGGAISEWQSEIWDIANYLLTSEFAQVIKDAVEQAIEELLAEHTTIIIEVAARIAEAIAAAISVTTVTLVGWVTAAVTFFIVAIAAGMEDDYYGTEVEIFTLPSNLTDEVKKIGGKPLDGGGWQTNTVETVYYGAAGYPSASAFDGKAALYTYWKFTKPAQYK